MHNYMMMGPPVIKGVTNENKKLPSREFLNGIL